VVDGMGRVYEFRVPVRIQEEKKKEDSVKWQRAQEIAEGMIDEMEDSMPFKPVDIEIFRELAEKLNTHKPKPPIIIKKEDPILDETV
jgi:hypothetical protein